MEYKNVLTTCVYCGCGCTFYLQVLDGEIVGVLPAKDASHQPGQAVHQGLERRRLCPPPRPAHDAPHPRETATCEEATWDEALALVAEKLGDIRDESGPDSIGFLTSAKCTNEENYLLQKLARAVIGTNNVDHCARL